jgi:glutamate-1-semialdehyde 2,1-aminomutase
MPFRRLFGRKDAPEAEAPEPTTDEVAEPDEETSDESIDDVVPEESESAAEIDARWRHRADDVIPGGASTGSKRAEVLYGDDEGVGPTHFIRASGCTVVTTSEATLIDCTMALGAVSLGYAEESVTQAVVAAAAGGNVAGLSHVAEVDLAERLCDLIPCGEKVRFLKSGGEAVTAAVRLARAATGRTRIVGCGYFGWQDAWSTGAGVPDAVASLLTRIPFDDVPALERACADAGANLAAILLEPVVERLPSPEWAVRARELASAAGAVLIFDEMKTGFRLATGGYQELAKVEPDLAVFGKALANGFPLAAVVGRAAIMDAARTTWISTTLAGEAVGIAAASAVLNRYEKDDVCASLHAIGAELRGSFERAVEACGIEGVTVDGIDPMWLLRFDDAGVERRFIELAIEQGLLVKRGAYNFAALAHGEEETMIEIERAASSAFVELMEEREA